MQEYEHLDSEATAVVIQEFIDRLCELYCEESFAIVGIHRRGDLLAARLVKALEARGYHDVDFGVLDITLYRDDFAPGKPQPTVRPSKISFEVDGTHILLIDDVFQTGRTVRAALTQLADFGRPNRVQLAVLVDRGTRELPIRPDIVGLQVRIPVKERIRLKMIELDGVDQINIMAPEGS